VRYDERGLDICLTCINLGSRFGVWEMESSIVGVVPFLMICLDERHHIPSRI
jgi:hypothetical protein